MPMTLAEIAALPGLGIRAVAGHAGLGRAVRLVHTSEVEDPTPWLRGGELLLTAGLRLSDPDAFGSYARQLAEAGIGALGFGIGMIHAEVPAGLIEVADEIGLPVLEIPYETPYVAISEAVSSRLAEERAADAERIHRSQRELTRCAQEAGPWQGVLPRLGALVEAWCVVVDAEGTPLGAAPGEAVARLSGLRLELDRIRALGARGAGAAAGPAGTLLIQPLAVGKQVHGHLVAGKADPFNTFDRMVVSFGVSLLSLELARAWSIDVAERRFRAQLVDTLVTGRMGDDNAARAVRAWGLPSDGLRVCVCVGEQRGAEAIRLPGVVCGSADGRELAVIAADAEAAAAVVASAAGDRVVVGVGRAARAGQLGSTLREARLAARVAAADGLDHAWFDELGAYRLLLAASDAGALAHYTDGLLAPLERHDQNRRGNLVASLDAYLRHGQQADRAAAELGVHRNTLRHRIRQIEDLSGRRLSSAHTRMEFWLALRLRQLTDHAC